MGLWKKNGRDVSYVQAKDKETHESSDNLWPGDNGLVDGSSFLNLMKSQSGPLSTVNKRE